MPPTLAITVLLSNVLRDYCQGEPRVTVSVSAPTVRATLDELRRTHPALHRSVCDETGSIRRHVNVFVNASNIRDRDGLDTALAPGDVVTLMPAVSGG